MITQNSPLFKNITTKHDCVDNFFRSVAIYHNNSQFEVQILTTVSN